jgi:CheY-like chemotaxis protein
MKVLLADDSKLVRERLAVQLCELEKVEVVGEADYIPELLELIQRLKPDVVVLDIHMPGGNGIQALEAIKKEPGSPVVIMLTMLPYPQYRKKCLEARAEFFFDKATEFDLVMQALKQLQDTFDAAEDEEGELVAKRRRRDRMQAPVERRPVPGGVDNTGSLPARGGQCQRGLGILKGEYFAPSHGQEDHPVLQSATTLVVTGQDPQEVNMLRCNRCGQYYIPGFLDCQCRTMSHRLISNNERFYASPSANRAMTALPLGAPKATRVTDSVDTESPVPIAVGSGSNPQRTLPQREKE